MLYQAELLRLVLGDDVLHLNPTHRGDGFIRCIDALSHTRKVVKKEQSHTEKKYVKINIVISGWLCILLGSGLLFASSGSSLVISLAGPVAILGLILLMAGLLYKDEGDMDPKEIASWEPDQTKMPDSGRIMYRVDTTLVEPIRTSILCGKCANLYWVEGRKPKLFECPECLIILWHDEEE